MKPTSMREREIAHGLFVACFEGGMSTRQAKRLVARKSRTRLRRNQGNAAATGTRKTHRQ